MSPLLLAAPVDLQVISPRTVAVRTPVTFPAVTLADEHSQVEIAVDTTAHLDAATIWAIALEISRDGGATWSPLCSATRSGGPTTALDGTPATTAGVRVTLGSGSGRQVRGTFTVTDGSPLATGLRLQMR